MPDFHFLSSASVLASHYSAYLLFLSTFFPLSPLSWLPRCSCSTYAFQVILLIPDPVSRAFFPVLCTWLSVCFLSSLPASLPQLFHRRSPYPLSFDFLSGASPCFRFLIDRFRLGSDYSASVSSLRLFPFLPHRRFRGALRFLSSPLISPSVPPVAMLPFRFCY